MSSLFNLTGEFLELLDMIQQGEYDEQVLSDTLEGIDFEIEVKADGYAKIIKEIEGNVATLKAEIDRLNEKKKSLENSVASLKKNLELSMKATGKTKFKTALFSFGIQKNPARVVYDDIAVTDERFLIQQEPKVDAAAVKDALKNGEVLQFAHLEQGESLRIR